jgi:UDP-N-acetylglucosamine 2-epimerase (non-hydrolysing)
VISDSGTISEESAVAGFSAVSLRDSIERPEALESGSMILTGVDPVTLLQAIEIELTLRRMTVIPDGYESFEFSSRVLKFLMSTAGKHKTWKGLRN